MSDGTVAVLGATSLVGDLLVECLARNDSRLIAYSRMPPGDNGDRVEWRPLPDSIESPASELPCWICLAPIWALIAQLPLLEAHHARRVVALSSTSRFTKGNSSDASEQALARRLAESEARLQAWAETHGAEWIVLRPTLIYGHGKDKNVAAIARFIRNFGWFPVLREAHGLRQPVHAQDVADACIAALQTPGIANRTYNLSGGETISYRDMVARIFKALDRPARFVPVPLWLFHAAIALARIAPRGRHLSTAMAERMNRDLVFDHGDATRDLAFNPRSFQLAPEDLVTGRRR